MRTPVAVREAGKIPLRSSWRTRSGLIPSKRDASPTVRIFGGDASSSSMMLEAYTRSADRAECEELRKNWKEK